MVSHAAQRFLLTVEETARYLSLSRMSVYRLIQAGALPSVKIGGSRRVSVRALEAYVEKLEAENGAAG
jgi:excisionase family DNA binding protein